MLYLVLSIFFAAGNKKGETLTALGLDSISYDRVVAYDFRGDGDRKLVMKGKIAKQLIRQERPLDPETLVTFMAY